MRPIKMMKTQDFKMAANMPTDFYSMVLLLLKYALLKCQWLEIF